MILILGLHSPIYLDIQRYHQLKFIDSLKVIINQKKKHGKTATTTTTKKHFLKEMLHISTEVKNERQIHQG